MYLLKQSANRNHQDHNANVAQAYDSMRQDALELEKIKHDLATLRVEIEQCEQDESNDNQTVNIATNRDVLSDNQQNHRYDPFAVDSSTT